MKNQTQEPEPTPSESVAQGMDFGECVVFCGGKPELVAQFDRLTGNRIGQMGRRAPLDAMIDEACGAERQQLAAFTAFVWDCVWCRLPREAFTDASRQRLAQ